MDTSRTAEKSSCQEAVMKKILTVPEAFDGKPETYMATGNEYVSLPHIDPAGTIERIGLLRLDSAALIEFAGRELLHPYIADGGRILKADACRSGYVADWLPWFQADYGCLKVEYTVCAPAGYKGFIFRAAFHNRSESPMSLRCGLSGKLEEAVKTVYQSRPLEVPKRLGYHAWTDTLVLELDGIAALGLSADPGFGFQLEKDRLEFGLFFDITLLPGEKKEWNYYVSVNAEADGAAAVNVDLRRRGGAELIRYMKNWLARRHVAVADGAIGTVLNRNLFFCLFYSTGRTVDTEQLVLMTSRSSKYYVSAAFWSRDSLLWSFPALLAADREMAREALLACFTRYIRNAGIHSLYISGTVLYPGFELDELAAYMIALERYERVSGDSRIMGEPAVKEAMRYILARLGEHFDGSSGLYATELDPSDDPVRYPFLTYDNVLVLKVLRFLAGQGCETGRKADALEKSIWEKCTVHSGPETMFAWSTDGSGRHEIYDDPPGSLMLLPYYGFCDPHDETYQNTVRWILSDKNPYYYGPGKFASAGCEHAPYPWLLSLCNRLYAGDTERAFIDVIGELPLDNGFACESYDLATGEVKTGLAFSTCAGFFANALAEVISAR